MQLLSGPHLPLSRRFAKIRQTLKSGHQSVYIRWITRTDIFLPLLSLPSSFSLSPSHSFLLSPLSVSSCYCVSTANDARQCSIISIIDELINRSYELSRPKARSLGYRCPASYRLSHLQTRKGIQCGVAKGLYPGRSAMSKIKQRIPNAGR